MTELITIFSSNIPIDCHILKGRLETEGIPCFIRDENIVWVDPFKAVAIGGVKLKVPSDKYSESKEIINLINQGKLKDENGEYLISETVKNETDRQNEILSIKNKIRNDSTLLEKSNKIERKIIEQSELEEIIKIERNFQKWKSQKFQFTWKQFFYELFDFERSIFKYFRTRPIDYYIEKEIVDNYINHKDSNNTITCPICNSENTAYGNAIDFKWDFLYLILSLIITTPIYPIRKKYHCFECGHNFKYKDRQRRKK